MKVIIYNLRQDSINNDDYEYLVCFKLGWLLLLSIGVIIIIFYFVDKWNIKLVLNHIYLR